jgi:hypothetical protein
MKQTNKDEIIEAIVSSAKKVIETDTGHPRLDELIQRYYMDDYISEHVLNNQYIKSNFIKLNTLMQRYERNYEDDFAKEFMTYGDKKADEYIERYRGMVESEAKIANLKENDKVIILGGGSLPLTALTYTKIFNAQCTCIDIDRQAVKTSKELIKHLNLQNKIDIHYGNAFDYPLKEYDLILVVCLLPKKKALAHVFKENNQAKIVFRSAIGLFKLWYGETSDEDLSEYKILKMVNTDKKYAAQSGLIALK